MIELKQIIVSAECAYVKSQLCRSRLITSLINLGKFALLSQTMVLELENLIIHSIFRLNNQFRTHFCSIGSRSWYRLGTLLNPTKFAYLFEFGLYPNVTILLERTNIRFSYTDIYDVMSTVRIHLHRPHMSNNIWL